MPEPPFWNYETCLLGLFASIILQVKQLRMDKQVLAAHQAATSALKACREAQGLTVDLVENALDAFAEVNRFGRRMTDVSYMCCLCVSFAHV